MSYVDAKLAIKVQTKWSVPITLSITNYILNIVIWISDAACVAYRMKVSKPPWIVFRKIAFPGLAK
jgi:hypothetical protein